MLKYSLRKHNSIKIDRTAKKAVLGECKYRKEPIDKKVYEELLDKDGLISKE